MMDYRERMDLMVSDPERYRAIVEAEVSEMIERDLEQSRERYRRLRRQIWRARACGTLTGLRIGMGLKGEHKHRSWCPNA